jgi:flagellar protein FliO/FliZ
MGRFFRLPLAAASAGLAAGGAWAQAAPPPEAGAAVLQMLLGLVAVVALLLGGLWLLKRFAAPRGQAAGLLRVVAGAAVGPRERVVVVEVGDTWLVVGVAPGQVRSLHRLPRPPAAGAAEPPPGKEFGAWLGQVMERRHAR